MLKRLSTLAAVCAVPLAALAAPGTPPSSDRSSTPEPAVRRTVIEDDGARIDELRVRGAVRSITVRPKGALSAEYEVLAPDAGRDTSSGPNSSKGAAGQRVWRVLSF
jgi:hypothetical protein